MREGGGEEGKEKERLSNERGRWRERERERRERGRELQRREGDICSQEGEVISCEPLVNYQHIAKQKIPQGDKYHHIWRKKC